MRCLIFFLRDTNFHSETAVIKMSKKKKKGTNEFEHIFNAATWFS